MADIVWAFDGAARVAQVAPRFVAGSSSCLQLCVVLSVAGQLLFQVTGVVYIQIFICILWSHASVHSCAIGLEMYICCCQRRNCCVWVHSCTGW